MIHAAETSDPAAAALDFPLSRRTVFLLLTSK